MGKKTQYPKLPEENSASELCTSGLSDGGGSIKLDATLLSALFGKSKEFSVGSAIPERVLLVKLKDKLTDTLVLPDGSPAPDNAALVSTAVQLLSH